MLAKSTLLSILLCSSGVHMAPSIGPLLVGRKGPNVFIPSPKHPPARCNATLDVDFSVPALRGAWMCLDRDEHYLTRVENFQGTDYYLWLAKQALFMPEAKDTGKRYWKDFCPENIEKPILGCCSLEQAYVNKKKTNQAWCIQEFNITGVLEDAYLNVNPILINSQSTSHEEVV